MTSAFGSALRRHRQQAGLTQAALAERAGVSSVTVSQLERGVWKTPRGDTALLLADALGLDAAGREDFFALIETERSPRAATPSAAELPASEGPLLGRGEALAELAAALDASRLVTLVGAGGIGKTRMALEFARGWDGTPVAWIGAESLASGDDLLAEAAHALGASERGGVSVVEAIAGALRGQSALLVADNLEHLAGAPAALGALLEGAPALRTLATSRQALRVRGERVLALEPLELPSAAATDADLLANPAVGLFLDRARRAGRNEPPAAGELAAIGRMVTVLDGLPLAIELAASQRDTLSTAAIADLLEHAGIRAIDAGFGAGPERHRTMELAVRASLDRQPEDAQRLMRLLAVFRGGFTAAHAAAAAAASGEAGIAAGLPSLLRASLVREDAASGGARFRMLEPVRLVGAGLAPPAETRAWRDAHLRVFAELAPQLARDLLGSGTRAALATYSAEHANLLAALDHAIASGDSPRALAIAAGMGFWWEMTSNLREGNRWLRRAIAADDGTAPARDRWTARWMASLLAELAGDEAEQERYARETAAIAREAGDPEALAFAHIVAGNVHAAAQRFDAAFAEFGAAIATADGLPDTLPLAYALTLRGGYLLMVRRDPAAAQPDLERAIALHGRRGNESYQATPLVWLAMARQQLGDPDAARAACLRALGLDASLDQPGLRAMASLRLASLAAAVGASAAGNGARLLGVSEAIIERHGLFADPAFAGMRDECRASLAAALGEPAASAAIAEGRTLARASDDERPLVALLAGA